VNYSILYVLLSLLANYQSASSLSSTLLYLNEKWKKGVASSLCEKWSYYIKSFPGPRESPSAVRLF
jgi:hypothetical protein